jgi:thioredoxin-like negative regulator of GroEL
MITRRHALLVLLAAGAVGAFVESASAAGRVPFARAAFDAALKTSEPVLIDISASWCPTCQRQKAILSDLTQKAKFASFTIFEVDYDTEKDVMRSFGAQQRSTLIAFKGGVEVGRIVGDTRPDAIEALLAKAI